MFEYVKVVSRLSNVIKWNKYSDVMESMLIPIKKGVNILTHVDFSKLFVDKMIKYVKVVSQFSNVVKWNKESDDMESMLIAIEKGGNIISYVDYYKI